MLLVLQTAAGVSLRLVNESKSNKINLKTFSERGLISCRLFKFSLPVTDGERESSGALASCVIYQKQQLNINVWKEKSELLVRLTSVCVTLTF